MLELYLIQHCAPTLAGVKSANLFTCPIQDAKMLQKMIDSHNQLLNPKGVHITLLRVRKSAALIYVYRPHALQNDLADRRARELLLQYGYLPENLNACVIHLIHRLCSAEEFPHEIGLFLSYPPEDVLGFILNSACNHKCVGCWKVYGNEQEAKNIFEKYRLCSQIYFRQWKQGKSIEQLTVAG